MKHPKFDEKELRVVKEIDTFRGTVPVFDFPMDIGEAMVALYRDKDPLWIPTNVEVQTFTPSVIVDNVARGFVFEGQPYPREKFGGKDMFGIEWTFVEMVGGSMVKPGKPFLEEISEWRDKIVFPDIDSWDWAGSAEMNKEYLNSGRCNSLMLLNGCWFERLISFMDFENAAVALIDEDDVEEVKALIHELTSLYIRIVDKCLEYYDNIHGFCIHDDWGAQKDPFFSEETGREVFLPEMKRFVDHVHSKGKFVDLHSCGHIERRCGIFVDAGFDSWTPMAMNNTQDLYEKYGDKILIGIVDNDLFDPETATEEEQREGARKFVERYTKPGKPALFSAFYNKPGTLTPAFREELYKQSRIRYEDK